MCASNARRLDPPVPLEPDQPCTLVPYPGPIERTCCQNTPTLFFATHPNLLRPSRHLPMWIRHCG